MIKPGWNEYSLKDVCLKVTKTNKNKNELTASFNYVDIASIDNQKNAIVAPKEYRWADAPSRAQQILQEGDIVFSTVRTYLKNIAVVTDKLSGSIGSTGFCVLRPNPSIALSRLIFYYTLTNRFLGSLNKIQRGTSYPAVRDSDVMSQAIMLPSIDEQERILQTIDELFSELENAESIMQSQLASLAKLREAIYKQAFEGCEEWVELSTVTKDIHYGYTAKSSRDIDGPQLLRITDIQQGNVDWNSVPRCKISDGDFKKYKLNAGDILFARTGATVGKSFLLPVSFPDSVFASFLIRVIPDETKMDASYLYHYFQSRSYWQQIYEGRVGIGQPNFNGSKLSTLKVPATRLEDQKEIINLLEAELSRQKVITNELEAAILKCQTLKQSILTKAFEGELI